ncbi:MFS transporter [Lentzea chajnantorensis]
MSLKPSTHSQAKSEHHRRWLVLAVLCTSLLLAGLDLTVLHVAVPALARDLDPSGPGLLWIVDVYSLTVAAFLIVCGTLADKIGRRRVALTGFALFGLASLAAAFAPSTGLLIAARAVLGLGTALIMAATVAIIRNVFPDDRERAFAIGLWTAAHSVGTTLGPLIGGALVEHFPWGSVFLVNVPVVVVVLVVGALVIPESSNPEPRPWDPLSVVLSVVGLAGFAYGLKEATAPGGLTPFTLAGGVAGIAVLVWFVLRQRRLHQPLLDLELFRNRRFSVAIIAVFGAFGSYVAMLFLLMQWFQQAREFTPLQAGAAIVPLAVANALGATLAPRIADRFGSRWSMTGALTAFAAALAFFAASPLTTWYPALVGVLVVSGFGAGIIMTSGADSITAVVAPERAGEAAAIQETSFELSAGMGVALLGSVLAVVYRFSLTTPPFLSEGEGDVARSSVNGAQEVAATLSQADAGALTTAAESAFDTGVRVAVGGAAAVLLVIAAAVAVLLRPPSAGEDPPD